MVLYGQILFLIFKKHCSLSRRYYLSSSLTYVNHLTPYWKYQSIKCTCWIDITPPPFPPSHPFNIYQNVNVYIFRAESENLYFDFIRCMSQSIKTQSKYRVRIIGFCIFFISVMLFHLKLRSQSFDAPLISSIRAVTAIMNPIRLLVCLQHLYFKKYQSMKENWCLFFFLPSHDMLYCAL
jgi:hypothetical protein